MKITAEDFINEMNQEGMNKVNTIYEIYNDTIDDNRDAVELINKLISHFSENDKDFLMKIQNHITLCGKYNLNDKNHPFNSL
jgi:hypothetical protein